ncbi:hypothetical protein G9A89_002428 [Geosiphon pyriformis]|nr:hypothetical protein G9A89_002428 [Geosiphon pyriformis]
MVTLNFFVVPDEILKKISTAAVSSLPDMNSNSNSISYKIKKDQLQAVLPDMVLSGRFLSVIITKQFITPNDLKDWTDQMEMESTASLSKNVNGCQKFSGWMASNLVPDSTFKIKIALLDVVKLFCMEFASQESLNGAIKVVIGEEVFLTTLKIAQSSGVASVSFPSLSVVLHDVLLDTSPNNIKAAFGIFGVVTSVKLKPDGLIFPVFNQREVIVSRNAFKAKLVNLLFGCTVFEISDLVFQTSGCCHCYRCQNLDYLAVDCKMSPPLPPKSVSNFIGGPKVFKSLFTGAKSYAKAIAFVVSPAAAAAGIDPVLDSPLKVVILIVSGIFPVPIAVVESRLAFMESHLNELALLVKSIIEPVGFLIVLVTKLLSTSPAVDITLRESVMGLERQVKAVAVVASMLNRDVKFLTKKCDRISLKDVFDNNDMNDDNNKVKDFSMSGMVKNSHKLVSIMGKMYEFDMFNTLAAFSSSGSFSSFLAGSSFPVKVSSKKHTWVSLSVVFITLKSPKIFNNRPVNKLVFSALTTLTTTTITTTTTTITTITTVSQMAAKAKNSKKQQQAVTITMVTPNFFVVSDEILGKISIIAASLFPDMDNNSSSISPKIDQD